MPTEWPEIRQGTREEALVNTHERSVSLAVSAEEVTINRGMMENHGGRERSRLV